MQSGGSHKGVQPVNVHTLIYTACNGPKGFDMAVYTALHNTLDLNGLYDILEMREVHDSWEHAGLKNAAEK